MGPKIVNKLKDSEIHGDFVGGDKNTNIIMFQDNEREFVVTRNANIKPVDYFIGREMELQELRQRIEEERKFVLVSGMGGIGKTHICRKLFEEYLNKHAKDEVVPFRYLGFIEYGGDMDTSLQNCLKFKKQDRPEQDQEAAWRELEYLAADGKLLLVVDNVNRQIWEDSGLQRLQSIPGAVVLTSRQVSFGDEIEPYRIGFLDMVQCQEIYEKIRFAGIKREIEPEEVTDLEYVIESLAGRHTLTVVLLAHLARTKTWSVKKLREKLEEKGFCLEFHKDGKLVNIQESYEALYDLSELTKAEQNILEAFSVFPYISLAAVTCNEWLLADAGVSEDDDILMGLYQKGWLQFDMGQESYALHPVLAQFIYEKCCPSMEKHVGLIETCRRSLEIPESGSVLGCRLFIPFAKNMIEKLDMENDVRQVGFMRSLAYLMQFTSDYKNAEELYMKNLRICREVLGEENADTASSYNNLAFFYRCHGKYKIAEELSQKSLKIYDIVFGENNLDTAISYSSLALVYHHWKEYKKAEELYKKSLQIRQNVCGENDLKTATGYNNLARLYEDQGEYGQAEELYKKSLQIRKEKLGEEHTDTAIAYHNLAVMYGRQKKYKEAERLHKKCLLIRIKRLGEEHPYTALSYNNLAHVYVDQGEYGKAEELFKKSLQIREKVYEKDHPYLASGYVCLANVYVYQGRYGKAQELYDKGLRIFEIRKDYVEVATIYNRLAVVYVHQGEYGKAQEQCEKSMGICKRVLGDDHPDTVISYNNLARVYEYQGEYQKAEELYEKILRIKKGTGR